MKCRTNWLTTRLYLCADHGNQTGFSLVTRALIFLHKREAIVKESVCDGAGTNKSGLSLLGVNGSMPEANILKHPIDENLVIYCFTDVPHLLKCTRNHFVHYEAVLVKLVFNTNAF